MKYNLVQFKTKLHLSTVLYCLNFGRESAWNIYLLLTIRLLWELLIVLSILYLLIKLGGGDVRKRERHSFHPKWIFSNFTEGPASISWRPLNFSLKLPVTLLCITSIMKYCETVQLLWLEVCLDMHGWPFTGQTQTFSRVKRGHLKPKTDSWFLSSDKTNKQKNKAIGLPWGPWTRSQLFSRWSSRWVCLTVFSKISLMNGNRTFWNQIRYPVLTTSYFLSLCFQWIWGC